jgi:uncharacterized protein (DUF362 family)
MANSRVIIIRKKGFLSPNRIPDLNSLIRMFKRGFSLLDKQGDYKIFLRNLLKPDDQIGIKINTLGGKSLSTRPEVPQGLTSLLIESGIPSKNIIIWDRTNRELKIAGYRLNMNKKGVKIFGTDSRGLGYEQDLTSHLNIGSRFSSIQSRIVTASISLAIVKDHGLAGVTAGLKNYFGAIHNPNKYHDSNCNPYIAELFSADSIWKKHRISILDALLIQYHRGPAYHSQWATEYGALIFSLDPVAADFTSWQIIEELRSAKGLPTLKEEGREPVYLKTAEKMELGNASPANINIIREEI